MMPTQKTSAALQVTGIIFVLKTASYNLHKIYITGEVERYLINIVYYGVYYA